jgi:hypothetical protein
LDGVEGVLEVEDSVEVAGVAVLECVDEPGGLASDAALVVGDDLADSTAVSEGCLEVGVSGASAVVDGVLVASEVVSHVCGSHFLGVVMMMRAAQIVIMTTQIPERRRISLSVICGLR